MNSFPSTADFRFEYPPSATLSATQGIPSKTGSVLKASYTHQSKPTKASILTSDARRGPHHWEPQALCGPMQHFKVRRSGFPDVSLLNPEPDDPPSEPPWDAIHHEATAQAAFDPQ
ncbi:hypothetical protein BGZ58_004393, partial [Dissophora ornata]